MRDDHKPGDLSVRLSFGRVYGTGPDRGAIKPAIEITDQTSSRVLTIELTPTELVEMFTGGAAAVPADRVNGFKGVRRWGKYLHTMQMNVKTESGDHAADDPFKLPHVGKVVDEIEAAGYVADTPRRNNQGQWVIIGRKYADKP
jgi:hypothetical protein